MKPDADAAEVRISPLPLTQHARIRMNQRRLSYEAVAMVMAYGRLVRVRDAEIYAIGRKEVARGRREGVDLSRFEGVQVVCSCTGTVLTIYRNSDFRGLRPHGGRRRSRLAA